MAITANPCQSSSPTCSKGCARDGSLLPQPASPRENAQRLDPASPRPEGSVVPNYVNPSVEAEAAMLWWIFLDLSKDTLQSLSWTSFVYFIIK